MAGDSLRDRHVRLETNHIVGGVNTITGEEVAIKCESHQAKHPLLESEYNIYKALAGGPGIPFIHWFGIEHNYNAIVVDLLGPSLANVFAFCHYTFSLKSILMLADQLISCIEYIHDKSFIHGDIRPGNFVLGLGKCEDCINVIDFGFTRPYRDQKSHLHIPYCENKRLTGTYRYASLNAHHSIEQSRRDDLESLGYMFVYFCCGSLPWQGLGAGTQQQKWECVKKKKMATTIEALCYGLPNEFATYFRYVRSLGFEDKPDYSYLRNIFRDLFLNQSFQCDYIFDWKVYDDVKRTNKNMVKVFSAGEIFLQFGGIPLTVCQLYPMFSAKYEGLVQAEAKSINVAKEATEPADTPGHFQLQEWAALQRTLLDITRVEKWDLLIFGKTAQEIAWLIGTYKGLYSYGILFSNDAPKGCASF
ncbi:hypothetical protein DTO063F5_3804 [Paecilomyces variotii]|nr:hypothetical protein DTO063F5_3804 [Paecilomyces variotii]